jgi:hypothetical protein
MKPCFTFKKSRTVRKYFPFHPFYGRVVQKGKRNKLLVINRKIVVVEKWGKSSVLKLALFEK